MKALADGDSLTSAGPGLGGATSSPLTEAVNVLRRRLGTVLGTVLVLTTMAALVGFLLPPQFTATAMVMLNPRQTRVVDIEQVLPDLPGGQETLETERSLIKVRPLVARAMEELDLFRDRSSSHVFDEALTDAAARLSVARAWIGAGASMLVGWVENLIGRRRQDPLVPLLMSEPDGEATTSPDREAAIDDVIDRIQVMQVGGSYSRVFAVSFTTRDPVLAADVANRLTALYVETQLQEKRSATRGANTWLDQRLQTLQKDVRQAEDAVAKFQAENKLAQIRGSGLGGERLAQLNHELMEVHSEVAAKAAKLNLVRSFLASSRDLSSLTDVMGSPVIEDLRRDQSDLERQLGDFEKRFGPLHPQMLALQESMARIERRINEEIGRIVRGLQDDLAIVQARERIVEHNLDLSRSDYATQNQAEVRLRELEREATAKRDVYRALLTRYQETRTQEGLLVSDARVVAMAAVPTDPSTPSPLAFLLIGFALSLAVGSMAALARERLDGRVRSSRQIERFFGLPVLGLVPKIRKERDRPLHAELLRRPRSHYSEVASVLYRSGLAGRDDRGPTIVLVTSALAGEGKTSLASSLAVRGAGLGRRTVLVDLDLRRPAIAREFGISPPADLPGCAPAGTRISDMITRDEATGVDVLSTKRCSENVAEFLMSSRLQDIVQSLRRRYEYIVLDAPPALGLVDVQILLKHADIVLFAIRWASTRLTAVESGLRMLREARARVEGVVLTRVDVKRYARGRYGDAGEHYRSYSYYYLN